MRTQGTLTDEDLGLIEERRAARQAELGERKAKAELGQVQSQIELEKAKPELLALKKASLEEDVEFEIEKADLKKQKREENKLAKEAEQRQLRDTDMADSSKSLQQKLGNTKLFGKGFLKALGPIGVGVGATIASQRAEAEGKTPFEQVFYTASEVLPVSAYDIEDLGKFAAKARDEGIPEALGLDTQKQQEMNIRRKERLAERSRNVSSANKQSSLDDQIQQLLSGR